MWPLVALLVVTTIIQIALTPRPKPPKPAGLEDFDVPVAEEGRMAPWVFGEGELHGYNVVWYGDLRTQPIKVENGKK